MTAPNCWYALFSSGSQFTTAFGLTKVDPIGSLVAGTLKTWLLNFC